MNAISSIEVSLPAEPFHQAYRRVNEWRGRCIDAFSRGEAEITRCLIVMSEVQGRGANVKLQQLSGQRASALSAAIAQGGPFHAEAGKAEPALEQFLTFNSLRNMLCHAVCEVTLDRQGRWTLILRVDNLKAGCPCPDTLVIPEQDAYDSRDRLIEASKKLGACLQAIQRKLRPAEASKP